MNTQEPEDSSPKDIVANLTAAQAAHTLDGADAAGMEHCLECPLGKALLASEGFEDASAAITASMHPPVEPPAGLKEKIFAKIDEEAKPKVNKGYHFIGNDEGEWQSLPGGKIRLKTLSDDPAAGHALILLEADPGATFLPHAHKGTEEVYLVSGELTTAGRTLQAGDYLRAEPGTLHLPAKSETGCRAIMVTARENHQRKAISAYDGLTKLLGKLSGGSKDS
ncbi:MAG: cupin domain-containing protein [Verrucomicrobiota bacterium JB023]|nr:cupin domain-containing protein [Verrucomicrobiota bacterium JB023]